MFLRTENEWPQVTLSWVYSLQMSMVTLLFEYICQVSLHTENEWPQVTLSWVYSLQMSRVTLCLGYMSSVTSHCDSVSWVWASICWWYFTLGISKRWWSLPDENWSLYVTLCWMQMLMVTLCWEAVNADGHFMMKTDGHFVSHYAVRIIGRCWSLCAWRESAGKLPVTKLWGWRL